MSVRVDRMKILRDYFAAVPEENVDMGEWWCGSAGCLAGHACRIPEFQKLGLRLGRAGGKLMPLHPFNDSVGADALAQVLNMDYDECDSLCHHRNLDGRQPSKADVLNRLDALIAKS